MKFGAIKDIRMTLDKDGHAVGAAFVEYEEAVSTTSHSLATSTWSGAKLMTGCRISSFLLVELGQGGPHVEQP